MTSAALPPAAPSPSSSLATIFEKYAFAFTFSNPRERDNPIVYASESFFQLTGYSANEIIGHNCRFLQGLGTDRQTVMELRDAMREERATSVCLLNYRKGGQPFWNALTISPVRCQSTNVVLYYLGLQADVTELIVDENTEGSQVENVVQTEQRRASQLAEELAKHSTQVAAACQTKCAVDVSVPSSLVSALCGIQACYVLSDPNLADTPMVYCSPQFIKLTGYSCEELLGHNCRMLQGPGTDRAEIEKIKSAIQATPPRAVTATLLNYRKSGEPFYNSVHIAPVRDADGAVQFFVGVQVEVSDAMKLPGQGVSSADAAVLSMEGDFAEDELNGTAHGTAPVVPAPPPQPSPLLNLQQKGVVGAVRVAARALSTHGLRRGAKDQQPVTPRSARSLHDSPFK